MGFRDDFVWGVATSAYQIEGAAYEDGKGENIWDVFCKEKGRVYEGQTGEVACDHYHLFQQDVDMMKQMGVKAYRFSINWARVLPEGYGKVNEAGIAFYDRLIDALLEAGIEPYITLYHWDMPYALYQKGGFLNEDMVEWFGDYAGLISERFSDRVTHFFTINEPQCCIGLGFHSGVHAPGVKAPLRDTFTMAHILMKAHGRAVQKIREKAKQPVQIGYAPTGCMSYPATDSPEDIEAARQHFFAIESEENWTWNVGWWSDPVLLGKYPEKDMERFERYLPKITDADMKLISEPIDIYGQNMYNGRCFRMGKDGNPEEVKRKTGAPKTAAGWPITPECMYWGTKFLYERYQKPIYITENGISCTDVVSLDGKVHDPNRIDFLARYLHQIKKASEDGVDIRGYFQWSLMDNFEWNCGYSERFGLVYVDYETQERIWKDSAYWYQKVIGNNGLEL